MEVAALIDGADVAGAGEVLPILDPSTDGTLGTLPEATPAQVAQAVEAAGRSFKGGAWRDAPVRERQRVLRAAAAGIRAAAEELDDLQIAEGGMTRPAVSVQVAAAAGWFDYYADFLSTLGEHAYRRVPGALTLVERVPMGVCALFSPWNVPLGLTAIKLAPALAAGNSVVLKPSEETPICTRRLVEIVASAGLPPGVVNLVNGRGAVTGAALAEHPGVDMIAFTGGAAGGRAVAEAAARRHVPCVMELGGKSAVMVFANADQEAAVKAAITGIYGANGEACLAGSRIVLEASIADDFLARFTAAAGALNVGPAREAGTDVGPMISPAHRDRVLGFYGSARADGDEVLFGGALEGNFVQPGAIRIASPRSRVWREEVFGPLAAIATFESEAEAVQLANDSDYGLAGYLWTRDFARAHRVAGQLRTGTVIVNSTFLREQNAPFGGFKASGIGREGGRFSWENFTQARTTVFHHGGAADA